MRRTARSRVLCVVWAISTLVCVAFSPDLADATEKLIDRSGITLDALSVKAWKGSGTGGPTTEEVSGTTGPVFFIEGRESDGQTVLAPGKVDVRLSAGRYYSIATELKSQDVEGSFDFIAALREGKNRDVFEKFTQTDGWTPVTLLVNPPDDVVPLYIAIRLFGKGKVFARPFILRELTREEFEQKKKNIADERLAESWKRLEKVFLPFTPTLPLPTEDSPLQFKIWGTAEESFPPPPFGWRRVPGERAELETAIADRLKTQDYLIYARPPATPVYLESLPKESELISGLSAQATPGEYEPLTFSVYAAKNLEGLRVRVSDLTSDVGGVIKSANLDIRTVNFIRKIKDEKKKTYFLMPLTLGKGPDWIDERTSRRYWLTAYIPPQSKPGLYRGTIHFEAANSSAVSLPVELTVLPFTLLDPPVIRFMWGPPRSLHQDNEYKMYQDLAEHGMTTMQVHGEIKTRDRHVGPEDIDNIVTSISRHLEYYRQIGFRDNPIGGISNHQIIFFWDKSINWFKYWPVTDQLRDEFLGTYRKVFVENPLSRTWPEFYHYIVDEPGGMRPENIDPSAHYLELFKKEFPSLKTFVTIGGGMKQGYDEAGKLSPNLDVTCTNYLTKDVIDRVQGYGSEYWVYNGASMNAQPLKERFFYGWYLWKTAAKGAGQWTYAWTENSFSVPFRDGRQDYALETKSGYMPTVGMEMIREGIDDYKYIHTLSSLLSLDTAIISQADVQQARKQLDAMREKINLHYQRGSDVPESNWIGLSAGELASFRDVTAQLISSVMKAANRGWPELGRMAAEKAVIGLQQPSESDWQVSAQTQNDNPDLLAGFRWGGLLSHWKSQIWKGSGRGEYDEKNHQQRKVIKLTITSDGKDDNGAVVLANPDIVLQGKKRYRLSAWLKTEDVSRHAQLYAAVRAGGINDLMSEKVSGTSDWKYVWLEFEPEEDCRAGYFAVRLWGSGSVYVDRVVLQEI